MSDNSFNDDIDRPASTDPAAQPLGDRDSSITSDDDAAQREWERTDAVEAGVDPAVLGTATATGADPDEIPSDEDDIPAADLPAGHAQPETQGESPIEAELGDDGQGDLAPEDL